MGAWDFYQDRVGKWRWRYAAAQAPAIKHSHVGYWSRNDCIADAMRHGYLTEGALYAAGRASVDRHPLR
jgi:uncharacterized protein YegP (UPF0339 family)